MRDSIKYDEILKNYVAGETELVSEAFGKVVVIGKTFEGDIFLQKDNNFIAIPSIEFDLHHFRYPIEEKTLVYYTSKEDLQDFEDEINKSGPEKTESEVPLFLGLKNKTNRIQVTLTIKEL